MKNIAVILASGTGERIGANVPKQFLKIKNKSIIEYSIEAFENNRFIDEIVMVVNLDFRDLFEEILEKNNYKKIVRVLNGGKIRMESAFIGIKDVDDEDNVLIHDGVRPFVSEKIINDCIVALEKYNAVGVGISSVDTIVELEENNVIKHIPQRKFLRRIQTPQCFKGHIIKKAHELAIKDNLKTFTDDCGLVLKYNLTPIFMIDGDEKNIKITQPQDLEFAENLLSF